MAVSNSVIIAELLQFLDETDFFTLYPTRAPLRQYLKDAVSDGDKIRAILRDEYVQRELFPDWEQVKDKPIDPVEHYRRVRRGV